MNHEHGCNLLLFQGTIKQEFWNGDKADSCNLLLFQGTIKLNYVRTKSTIVVTYYYFKVRLNVLEFRCFH